MLKPITGRSVPLISAMRVATPTTMATHSLPTARFQLFHLPQTKPFSGRNMALPVIWQGLFIYGMSGIFSEATGTELLLGSFEDEDLDESSVHKIIRRMAETVMHASATLKTGKLMSLK